MSNDIVTFCCRALTLTFHLKVSTFKKASISLYFIGSVYLNFLSLERMFKPTNRWYTGKSNHSVCISSSRQQCAQWWDNTFIYVTAPCKDIPRHLTTVMIGNKFGSEIQNKWSNSYILWRFLKGKTWVERPRGLHGEIQTGLLWPFIYERVFLHIQQQ